MTDEAIWTGPRLAVVVMGVSGSGKSTLGAALAARLGVRFIEGDDLHPARNVARMRAGLPLDDAMRAPWLQRVGEALEAAVERQGLGIASCSALKRRYRDQLRAALGGGVAFLWPVVGPDELARRMGSRPGHYMPAALLQSQLDTLEPPGPDERCLRLEGPLEEQVRGAERWLRAQSAP